MQTYVTTTYGNFFNILVSIIVFSYISKLSLLLLYIYLPERSQVLLISSSSFTRPLRRSGPILSEESALSKNPLLPLRGLTLCKLNYPKNMN